MLAAFQQLEDTCNAAVEVASLNLTTAFQQLEDTCNAAVEAASTLT